MKDCDFYELINEATQEFYNYEDREYPNGDSLLTDQDRMLFVVAWALGYRSGESKNA
jgi:hypothetical protein